MLDISVIASDVNKHCREFCLLVFTVSGRVLGFGRLSGAPTFVPIKWRVASSPSCLLCSQSASHHCLQSYSKVFLKISVCHDAEKKIIAVSLKDHLAHWPALSLCRCSALQSMVISCLTLGVQCLQLHHDKLILVLVHRNRVWVL